MASTLVVKWGRLRVQSLCWLRPLRRRRGCHLQRRAVDGAAFFAEGRVHRARSARDATGGDPLETNFS